jgi:tubulin polyglutamylase TTLL1
VNKLSQIKKWSLPTSTPSTSIPSGSLAKEAYIISRYLDSPHLIGGKKYDLRIYVLVTSFHPLRVYQYQHGFARFCNVKYTTNLSDMNNEYIHLTNVAIQSHNENYNATHGGKWSLDNLKLYIESTSGLDMSNTLFYNIDQVIIHSLKSVQNVIMNDKHCFECYGTS